MSEPQLITYRKFNDLALTEPLIDILQKHDIEYELIDSPILYSASLAFNEELSKEYDVKIKPKDFVRVNELILEDEVQHVDDVDSDYYLFAFSDNELMDVLKNYDEWSAFDCVLARKLLGERGVTIDDTELKKIEEQRFDALKQPETSQRLWVVIGYMAAFLGGVLGIFIGWYLSTGKKTLSNGERVYVYIDTDRKHGNRIFFLSVVIFVIALGFRFYQAVPK